MKQVVQCIPNFSEGRNRVVVEAIVRAAGEASSARIIDYSSDHDHNRMVLTLLGTLAEIVASVLAAAREAVNSIDMRVHEGEHPRIGAVDVVPVVPIAGVTMDECVKVSYEIGNLLANDLGIPVYYYEKSALSPHRANLADIRRGGYEALCNRALENDHAPDAGPAHVHPTAGATAVGARGPLIAYNINFESSDINIAREIARRIRTGDLGRRGVKSIGVWLASRNKAQVSMNITQPDAVSLMEVYKSVQAHAAELHAEAVESEIIGAVRRSAFEGTSVDELHVIDFKDSQVIDNWL